MAPRTPFDVGVAATALRAARLTNRASTGVLIPARAKGAVAVASAGRISAALRAENTGNSTGAVSESARKAP